MNQRSAEDRFGGPLVWAAALLFVVAASIIARHSATMALGTGPVSADRNSVFGLAYGFGPSVYALVKLHRFGMLHSGHNWWAVALRMPFIPWMLAALSQVSTDLTFQFLAKNLIIYSLVLLALRRLAVQYQLSIRQQLGMVLVLFLIPFNILTGSRLEVEEGYLYPLMMILFALLLLHRRKADYLWCGLVIAAIYLTKSSMGPLCIVAVLWIVLQDFLRERSLKLSSFLPVLALLIAVTAWGGYVKQRTGRFAIGADGSSWNGENLYKANNPHVLEYYPYISLDNLGYDGLLPITVVPHNEWELSDADRAMAVQFILEHPRDVFKMDLRKLRVLFYEVRESPGPTHGKDRVIVMLSNAVDHLAFALFLGFALFDLWRGKLAEHTILALAVAAAYLTPYFVGFLYQRHLVPLFGVVLIALCLRLSTAFGGHFQGNGVPTEVK